MEKIKVFVVDDHALVRDGIIFMLNNAPDIQIMGEAADGLEALEKIEDKVIDIILMDIVLPGMNGVETAAMIKKKRPEIKILFLSMEVNENFVADAIKVGASGYLPKDSRKGILLDAIRIVYKGETYFPSAISEVVFKSFMQKASGVKKEMEINDVKLSDREIEIVKLLAKGINHKAIGEQLFISPRTVDAHRTNIMKKLNLSSTAELVVYAIKKGYIDL